MTYDDRVSGTHRPTASWETQSRARSRVSVGSYPQPPTQIITSGSHRLGVNAP